MAGRASQEPASQFAALLGGTTWLGLTPESRLRLYVDEDTMDGDLVRGLRSRGIDVVTAAGVDMIRRKDEDHLGLATVQGPRSIFVQCPGIPPAPRLLRLFGTPTDDEMRNREEFLGRW